MSETPVNLNKARKARAKADKAARAAQNVVKHGRTKAERQAEAARSAQAITRLDGHRREP